MPSKILEPIRIDFPFAMDAEKDPTSLPPSIFQDLTNFLIEEDSLKTREGIQHFTSSPVATSGHPIYGMHRFYGKKEEKEFYIAVDDKIKYLNTSSFTNFSSDANTTVISGTKEFQTFYDRTYVTNYSGNVLEIKKETPQLWHAGLPSPDKYVAINLCENVSEWSVSGDTGYSMGLDSNYAHITEGDGGIYLKHTSSDCTALMVHNFASTLDLRDFNNPDATDEGWDYIAFDVFRFEKEPIEKFYVEFSQGNTNFSSKQRCAIYSETELNELLFPDKITTATYITSGFQDTGRNFEPYETIPLNLSSPIGRHWKRSKYKIWVNNTDATVAHGWIGDAFTVSTSNDAVAIYKDPKRKEIGWRGTQAGKTASQYRLGTFRFWDWGKRKNEITTCAQWAMNPYDHQMFNIRLRKRWFEGVNTSTWNDMRAIKFTMNTDGECTSSHPAKITVDNIRHLKTPPVAIQRRIQVAYFDSFETWSSPATITYNYGTEGNSCLKIPKAQTVTYTYPSAKNLKYYSDGQDVTKENTVVSIDIAGVGGGDVELGFTAGAVTSLCVFRLQTKIMDELETKQIRFGSIRWTNFNTINWEAITSISVRNSTTDAIWVDNWRIEPHRAIKRIDPFEGMLYKAVGTVVSSLIDAIATEYPIAAWVGAKALDYAINHKWNGQGNGWHVYPYPDAYETGTASRSSLLIGVEPGGSYTFTVHRNADLTQYSTLKLNLNSFKFKETSILGALEEVEISADNSDIIRIWMCVDKPEGVREIIFRLYQDSAKSVGIPTADLDNYWEYTIDGSIIQSLFHKSGDSHVVTWKRGDFKAHGTGTDPDLLNMQHIGAYSITVVANPKKGTAIAFDNWEMREVGNLDGTYWFKIGLEDNEGYKSNYSEMSKMVIANHDDLSITQLYKPSDTRVANTCIYRLGGANRDWRLIKRIPPTETSFIDNLADEDVDILAEEEYYAPPKAKYLQTWQNRMWYLNIIDRWGKKWPSRAYHSRETIPFQVKDLDYIDINPNDGSEITGSVIYYNHFVMTKERSIWSIEPTDYQPIYRDLSIGCIAPRSLVVTPYGIIFLSHEGIVLYDLSHVDKLFGLPVKSLLFAHSLNTLTDAVGFYEKDHYYLFYGTNNTNGLACYLPRKDKGWTKLIGYNVQNVSIWAGDNNEIYFGDKDGYVKRMFNGNVDLETNISSSFQTADFNYALFEHDKRLQRYYLQARAITTNPTIVIKPYKDQVATEYNISTVIDTTTFKSYKELGYDDIQGNVLSLKGNALGRLIINGIQMYSELMDLR